MLRLKNEASLHAYSTDPGVLQRQEAPMPITINPKLLSWASDGDVGTILQAEKTSRLPIVFDHVSLMPDAHVGLGATVGSVIPTKGAIIPAAVGVDIGCGMVAARTALTANDLPDNLAAIRSAIEKAVPHGRTNHGGEGDR